MRNLKLLRCEQTPACESYPDVRQSSIDPDTGTLYCATRTLLFGLTSDGKKCYEAPLTEYIPTDGSGDVIGLQYLPDQQSNCVATSSGDVLLCNSSYQEIECVGNVDSGLLAMAWSPDQDVVVFVTGADTLILMNREFDPITEVPLQPPDAGEAEFVNVGWGKKETQFHGSEGKDAAKKKAEEVGQALYMDDQRPRVSWRGDGQYFVVSSIHKTTGCRCLHVWTRECILHSTGEVLNGLEQALAWKPSGSLIASTRRKPNKHEVVFFEKNGLNHGEFTLPFQHDQITVCELLWNSDSTVLAVWCEELTPSKDNDGRRSNTYIQLWTVNNYHWYLKQSLHFISQPGDGIVTVLWDPEQAYKLHVVLSSGQHLGYTWAWTTDNSLGKSADDDAVTAVIDGDQVLVTPFRVMVVPPPMCAYSLQLPAPVCQVAFGSDRADIAVITNNNKLAIYKQLDSSDKETKSDDSVTISAAGGNGFKSQCNTHRLQAVYSIDVGSSGLDRDSLTVMHLTWVSDDLFVFAVTDSTTRTSLLCSASLSNSSLQISCVTEVQHGVVSSLCRSLKAGTLALQTQDGSLFRFTPASSSGESGKLESWSDSRGAVIRFPYFCTQMATCAFANNEVVLGLTERYRFYVNDVEFASNCTSFAIHDEFLLLTTLAHTLRCICFTTKVSDLHSLLHGKAHPFDESVRRVERGSRIVTAVRGETTVVLQMPRGNLEVIHPRALVLSAIKKHLDNLQYQKALILMRKHRINTNLIYDHDPECFRNNVLQFVLQVKEANYINLFLTDLQEEDVTVTMYTATYKRVPVAVVDDDDSDKPKKVDVVCDCMREALTAIDKDKYILSILTCHVKKTKPDLEEALHVIKQVKESPAGSRSVTTDETLKYLLFLVDVNNLYDVALGMYDFDLVLLVAQKSQKDPKEYVPFLNELRRMEGNMMKYTIDVHLRRFHKALVHISKCGPDHFDQCLSLIQEHKLYLEAIPLFPNSSNNYKQVCKVYGQYLCEKNRQDEAGVMFLKAGDWQMALDAFVSCHNWRQVFCVTSLLGYTPDKEIQIARKLAAQIKDLKNYSDAAVIFEQHAKDTEEAIVCLVEGCLWDEALRMMYKHTRTDFIETNLKSGLLESHSHTMEGLQSMRTDFDKHRHRLRTVREHKRKASLDLLDGESAMNVHNSDLFSDTSSVLSAQSTVDSRRSTVISRVSGQSARSRRRGETKRWSLKEGSQFEEFALIDALSKLIVSVDSMRDEINSLMKALVQFSFDEKAATLQSVYDKFLGLIEKSIPDIWSDDDAAGSTNQPTLGPGLTANAIAQAMQKGETQKQSEKLDPVLRVPPKLRKEVRWRLHMVQSTDS
ncbi:putative elongator complex protein 1 [Gigantopelta aegis]|uniref:putative elongator complex protein 1 n=1 Tax=Gigantopelta aegis TaxID=1735272 RepID=UPI001B88C1C4|nr:putative elongator complex protein 1 [Gigantopelta aegis]